MVSKKSWEKFKRDVEGLTKTGVEKESWGKRSSNKDQNVSFSRNRRTSAPISHTVEAVERTHDDDIKGFSSSDEDQSKTMCESVKSIPSVSKRALCHSAPVKKRKRFKKYDIEDVKDATPITGFHRRTLDSLRNGWLACGSNKLKVVSSNFDNSFATVSPLFALHPTSSCNNSSANLTDTKTEESQGKINESEDIAWSDSGSDNNSEREMAVCDHQSPSSTSQTKIPFSSQQGELNQVLKVDSKAVCDIDEFESDSEKGEECADDKESVPSISPNTPTPTPTSPKIAEMKGGPPLDSAKKRKPKYLRSGLAERLRKLILRENSEKSFWFHKLQQLKEAREDDDESSRQTDGSVTLRVVSSHLDHSVHVLKCDVISQDVISERQLPDRVIVLLDNETRKQLDFRSKPTYLRIYSSWKIFDLPNSCFPVLLCITHCEVLPFLASHLEAVSSMIVEEPRSASTKQVDQPLTKTDEECSGNDEVMNDDEQARELRKNQTSEDTPNVFSSLLDVLGLQGQCLEGRVDLTGRIQRVYWREVRSRKQTLNCTSSLVTSLIERSRVLKEGRDTSLCFLAQDSEGFCSEVRVSSNVLLKKAEWQEALCTAEGSVVSFRGLRLVEHRKRKRRPGLSDLIDSLSDTVAYKEGLAKDKSFKRGTAKQTVCLSLSPDEETVLQRLSEEEANDCVPYYPSKFLTRTSPPLDRQRVKLHGQLLHATFKSDQHYGTNHVRLFVAGAFVANESSESDVSCSSDTETEMVSHSLIQVQYSGRRTLGWDKSAFSAGQLLSMQDLVIDEGSRAVLTADTFSNIQILTPQSTFSIRSSTQAFHVDDLWRKTTSVAMDDEQYSHLRRASRAILPQLNAEIESDSLVTFEGIVFDVDQANAFCWLTCNECGSDDISELQENSLYICNSCALDISSPMTNTHLEVYLKSASSPELRIKAKLLQTSISRLLPEAEDNSDEGYDVRCILNKCLGPMSCYVVSKLDNERGIQENPKISFKLEELDDSSWTH